MGMIARWLITSIGRTAGLTMMVFILVGAYGDLKAKDCSRLEAVLCKVMIGLSVLGILAINAM